MDRLSLDIKLILIVLGTFIFMYVMTFPMGWLISDVYSYLNQGIAIAKGEKILTYIDAVSQEVIPYNGTSYPLGNAFWIAFWIKLCGLKYVYFGSLFSIVASTFLILKILIKESFFKLSILLVFVYPSLAFFSKTLMSSVPSFLIVSIFLYVLFLYEETGRKWFLLAFIAALYFWFRETNIVLLGGICLIHFIQDRRWFLSYAGGAILGFVPRIISSNHYYGDPFHYVLAENFSIQNFMHNIGVYTILLLCFMPFGLLFISRYLGRYFIPLLFSSLAFILMYSCYSFNATDYSGFYKGIILMGRFLIPILPIYIVAVGWQFRNSTRDQRPLPRLITQLIGRYAHNQSFSKTLKIIATILVSILIVGMQVLLYKEAKIHKNISNHILENYSDKMVMFDLSRTTNIVRYINPFHGDLSYISDISNLRDDVFMDEMFAKFKEVYLIQTLNTGNEDKEKFTSIIDALVNQVQQKYRADEVELITIKPSLNLQILKIKAKDAREK